MNRLQKKCLIASLSFHGLLILVLLFGAALMPEPPESNFKPITLYDPSKISDLPTSSPGTDAPTPPANPPPAPKPNPPAAQSTPTPPTPKPLPETRRVETPKPIEEPPKPKVEDTHWYNIKSWVSTKPDPKPEVTKDDSNDKPTKKHKIVLTSADLKTKPRTRDETVKANQDAETKAERQRIAKEFTSTLRNIGKNLSTSTMVDMPTDSGPASGEVSVNYRDIIASKYYNAWIAPSDLDEASTPVVVARVTISRSGDVISAHVIKSSGNASMDRSIENVLQTVTFIEPFPASSKDQERTVTIKFNLQTKREIG